VRKVLAVFIVMFSVLAASLGTASQMKITREDLNVDSDLEATCRAPNIPSFWFMDKGFPDINLDRVANYFGVFAAYSLNAYDPGPRERFDLSPETFGWSPVSAPIEDIGGFHGQFFTKETPDHVFAMVVFRGTDGILSIPDNSSNATWVTQMLNPWDQYRTARRVVSDQIAELRKRYPGKRLSFLAVGHSLGGGLARHVATAFPCFAAIAFNSSFASNNFRLKSAYKPQIVDIFEEDDPLSRVSLRLTPAFFFSLKSDHQWYRVRNVASQDGQHGIFRAAAAMARIPADCVVNRSDCAIGRVNHLSTGFDELGYAKDRHSIQALLCQAAPPTVRNEPELCK
jgi:pimeloyl-ACP methyl ester carboxylesterase